MGRGYVRYRPERILDSATEAQVQAMNSKLLARSSTVERRAVNAVVVGSSPTAPANLTLPLEAVQSPKEKAALEWEKPVAGADGVYTKCRNYACSKGLVMGKMLYSLSRRKTDGTYEPINCRLDNFMQAKELAKQDWEKRS